MESIMWRQGETLLELGKRCDAIYICPKDGCLRKGPLVAYAGKDSQGRNLVGDMYFNFRKIEVHPAAVEVYAMAVCDQLYERGLIDTFDTICGIPNGGRTLGQILAHFTKKRFAYADKKQIATEVGKKQEYEWDLSQFDLKGARVAVAEDVFNNFENTDKTLAEIAAAGAEVVVLVGALNRSPDYDKVYTPRGGAFVGRALPVVASIHEAYPEYRQDDPEVAGDIAAGNLELEVKKNWARLREIMER